MYSHIDEPFGPLWDTGCRGAGTGADHLERAFVRLQKVEPPILDSNGVDSRTLPDRS